ncbi:glycoside hydrolase family 88 protein, partial [Bacteroidota bacterium]
MKLQFLLLGILVIILFNNSTAQISNEYLNKVSEQLIKMDNTFDGRYPEYTINGIYKYRDRVNWLSGFTGGELWNIYELTGNEALKNRAIKHADSLIEFASIDYTHDMGFMFLLTVVKAYKVTGLQKYKQAGITAARMLAKRFNSNGNFLRAWGKLGDPNRAGWMIIDTMMNLELLFWAWLETGDYTFYDIAYKHAITCMKQNIRTDFSSHHVIEFDTETGEVIKKRTHQGLNNETTWARGQAWGIYGFATAYKYTGDKRFFRTSKKMADVLIQSLPEDFVPYWDLSLSGEGVVRDASAGAIAASGMYLVADACNLKSDFINYNKYADTIAESIINNYSFLNSSREREEGLLLHTVYNFHKGWGVDESYTCGDYYYTEVLKKYAKKLNKIIELTDDLRKKIIINDDWFYLEDNFRDLGELQFSTEEWQKINVPH